MENVARQECEEGMFRRGELPGRFTARKLFCYESPREEGVSHALKYLISNIKLYNGIKI